MKLGFWVEQCMHAFFECPEDVNEITKNQTKVVSGEFCVISLICQLILVYLLSFLHNGKTSIHLLPKN